jgi:fructose-bisphosphate aldolase class I
LRAWSGANEDAGQKALLERAKANSDASCGLYANSKDGVSNESLFVSDYKY